MDIFLFYLTKKVVDNGIEMWYSNVVNKEIQTGNEGM